MPANKAFYDTVRPLFGGRLTSGQVDGMSKIVAYAEQFEYSVDDTAYVLGNTKHETANWMQPIREGARRFGLKYTDEQSRRAVASIHAKGIIRENYALPAGPYGQSYYGRGLTQITWWDNYKKFGELLGIPLEQNPDLALEWPVALDIMFLGMRDGLFTGKAMKDYKFPDEYRAARAIVNGDVRKNGELVAGYARKFREALLASQPAGDNVCR